jgi:hypothetical protein
VARARWGISGQRWTNGAARFRPHCDFPFATPLPAPAPSQDCRVRHLEPVPRRARPVGRGQPLGDDALQAHDAGLPEDGGAVIGGRCRAGARRMNSSRSLRALKPLTRRRKKRNPIANPRLSGWADVLTGVHDSRSSDSGGRLSECYRYPKPTR